MHTGKQMLRRMTALLAALALTLTLLPAMVPEVRAAASSGYCGENDGTNLRWTLDASGTLIISGTGRMKDFGPPADPGGSIYPAPWNQDCISVVIQEGVTSIGRYAFWRCPNLRSIQVAGSVQEIGESGIAWNSALEHVEIRQGGTGRTLGTRSLCNNQPLKELTIPEGFVSLGKEVLSNTSGLETISLPDSLVTIGDEAFNNCAALTELVLPRNVTSVGQKVFDGCSGMQKVTAPAGLSLPSLPQGVETKTYTGPTPRPVPVTGVTLDKMSLTLAVGGTATLTATVLPTNASNKNVTWSTSNSSVAVVADGVVTTKKAGAATITATTEDGSKTASCTVTVTGGSGGETVPVTGVSLNRTNLTLAVGSSETLAATVSPSNASNKNVTWSTTNSSVAAVADGRVTGMGAGTATITVTTEDGSKTASCTVTVTGGSGGETVRVTGVTLNRTNLTLAVGGTATLTATVAPANAANKAVTWSTSNSAIATVEDGRVTAKKAGTATITVTTADSGKTAFCTVTVTGGSGGGTVPVTGVSLDKTSLELAVGSSRTLTATVTPYDASNKNVTWSTTNSSVATVADGRITGQKAGTATITVTTEDGSKTASCTVTVTSVTPGPDATVIYSGSCGTGVTFKVYSDGLLLISGNGRMTDFARTYSGGAPWRSRIEIFPYKTVRVESGVESIGTYAFWAYAEKEKKLESVQLPDSVTKIGESAFTNVTGLKQAVMPGVTEIGDRAFVNCSALNDIELSNRIVRIGDNAFTNAGLQGSLTFPETLESIGREAFSGTGLTEARVYYKTKVPADAFPAQCRVEYYGAPALKPGDPLPISGQTAPAGSDNIHMNSYSAWSQPVLSYLASGNQGGFRRVDCYSWRDSNSGEYLGHVMMEEYDKNGAFLCSWEIPWELPYFGGFYESDDAYYFAFADSNGNESDARETVRVVKYTKDLEPLGRASLLGGNTSVPFHMGSLRMVEGDGTLYIFMAHQMYASPDDGIRHQSGMVLAVDTATMELRYQGTGISDHPFYVSHSMNQFIRFDSSTRQVVAASQGDTYPRALNLMRASASLGETRYLIPGGRGGNNNTATTVGGLEISRDKYLTAFTTIDQSNFAPYQTFNAYLSVIDKTNKDQYRNVQITNYAKNGPVSAANPFLVKFSDDKFAVLWEEQKQLKSGSTYYYSPTETTGEVKYAFFDGNGRQQGGIRTMPGALSDCQPVVIDGKATWYVTEDGNAPVFYWINDSGTSGSFKPTIGRMPTRVSLPDDVLSQLTGSETVLAASHDARGRMNGIAQGVLLMQRKKAEFTEKVSSGWTLYFLDEDNRPVCPPMEVS